MSEYSWICCLGVALCKQAMNWWKMMEKQGCVSRFQTVSANNMWTSCGNVVKCYLMHLLTFSLVDQVMTSLFSIITFLSIMDATETAWHIQISWPLSLPFCDPHFAKFPNRNLWFWHFSLNKTKQKNSLATLAFWNHKSICSFQTAIISEMWSRESCSQNTCETVRCIALC